MGMQKRGDELVGVGRGSERSCSIRKSKRENVDLNAA